MSAKKRLCIALVTVLGGVWTTSTYAQEVDDTSSKVSAHDEKAEEAEMLAALGDAAQDTAESEENESGDETSAPVPEADEPEDLVIVGSRRAVRSVLDSATPVDSIKASDFTNQGTTDVGDLLRTLVPSYNVNTQPISDAATLIRPANLRGLPPDSTVVLVNGKRRHRGSVITFLGAGLSDGSHGVDLTPIPALALKRVDVLRDGAAAQYGSDAIAGVMNFVLRDDAEGITWWTKVGSYLTEDADEYAWSTAVNAGVPLTDSGFFNVTVEYGHAQPTDRSVQRADAEQLSQVPGLEGVIANPAQVWGSPKVSGDLKTFVNMGIDLTENVHLYAFGNFARRDVLGGFYYRNPRNRGGVYNGPEVDGRPSVLVGDTTPDNSADCPALTYDPETLVFDSEPLAAIQANPNCFIWNDRFPGGFTPQFGGEVTDLSLAGGLRGTLDSGLSWDISAVVGASEADFLIQRTINSSLGDASPTSFNPGAYREIDQTYNLDLSYPVEVSAFASPLTVSTGFEYRKEVFEVSAGDPASYAIGPLSSQGFGVGSNGFPGFTPRNSGTFTRENIGAYLELAADVTEPWTVQLAARVEDFDTFGTQGTVKASTRLELLGPSQGSSDMVAIRGSVGTGYRAPSAGQANVTNVTTVAGNDGVLEDRGTIPPTNPIAVLKGGTPLDPETSINATIGFAIKMGRFFELTADYYHIKVYDRIAQSTDQTLTDAERQTLEESGVAGAGDLASFRFFTNDFDTTTQGIDLVASTRFSLADAGALALNLAYTWNLTNVDNFTPGIISADRINEIEDTLPLNRAIMTANYFLGGLRATFRANYFDTFESPQDVTNFIFSDNWFFDAELAYTFIDEFTLVVGGQNVFDGRPQENPERTNVGNRYAQFAPAGFNGGFYYTRVQITF